MVCRIELSLTESAETLQKTRRSFVFTHTTPPEKLRRISVVQWCLKAAIDKTHAHMDTTWIGQNCIVCIITWKARARILLAAGTSSASHLDLAPISHRTSALGQWATALWSRASKDSLKDAMKEEWMRGAQSKLMKQSQGEKSSERIQWATFTKEELVTWCRGSSQSRRLWARHFFYWGTPAESGRRWPWHTPALHGTHTET